jgi:hypothetical protein
MPRPPKISSDILVAALAGLEEQKRRLDEQIQQVRIALGTRAKAAVPSGGLAVAPRKRPKLSEAARKRISEAQKKRWAAIKRAKA